MVPEIKPTGGDRVAGYTESGKIGEMLSRVTEHVLVELRAGGFLEHMARFSGVERARESDKLWDGVSTALRDAAIREAASTPTAAEQAGELEHYAKDEGGEG